jgi:hypothetical protein
LVVAVLKAFPIQRTYEREDETLGEGASYTVRLLVTRTERTRSVSQLRVKGQFRAEESELRRCRTEEVQNSQK